ncbi:heterokaryon incompatibility protein-domain-containing protein [Xylariaceae sp. AK1471]|nr:heterokaryon incompatibility protein-domain-containing protein [Xylariaceae sp. AK1471]
MFVYQGFDLKGSTFRLIRLQKGSGIEIKCELIHTTLDDNVIPYEAVSYTWGTMMRTNSVYVKGNRLPITSNLWRLLHDLRNLDTDRYLWVDAICINQDDDLERGHQVHRMKHIYRGAERVLFYLSPQASIADVVMSSLAELQKSVAGTRWAADDERWDATWREVQTRLRCQYHDLELRQRQGLEYLLQRPFFRRVWILQEVASARRASVFCGINSISANVFAVSLRLMGVSPDTHSQAVIDLILGSLNGTTNPLQGENLASLLERFRESEASDERDRIYALLGLCEVTSDIRTLIPDYTIPVSDVIKNTLAHIHNPGFAEQEPVAETVDELLICLRVTV